MNIQDIWNHQRRGKTIAPQQCVRCGKSCKAAAIRTLFADEAMCIPCAQEQHRRCKGKVTLGVSGTMLPGHDGKGRRK